MSVLLSREQIIKVRAELKRAGKRVVFTNGVFDILHAGHVDYLVKAREFGDALILGLNSDASVSRIKGEKRPIVTQEERAFILANLKAVDYVTLFEEDTPFNLISAIVPDILVKGADWDPSEIVGKNIVEANGGEVKTIPFINFTSTSNIIKTILDKYKS
ncbi:MAG: D-glycero-beta-D-manno-heptose 1-phosphate adenylyltransferase [Ignavibacteriaceae bacterium]|nr:D-glycero-beta-D-manno-heptose 1-phosphate adenylyltransferase [Ignavibacteriaceae bacterium]